jgi:hypothetical protein
VRKVREATKTFFFRGVVLGLVSQRGVFGVFGSDSLAVVGSVWQCFGVFDSVWGCSRAF